MKFKFNLLAKVGMLFAVMLFWGSTAMAQRTITGTVTDAESGETLIGATVAAVGTTRGAVCDIDGNYSLEVPNGVTQLRVSYTGYEEQIVPIGSSNVVNVSLNRSSALDEVVVIGYGTVKKKDATGSVVTLSSKDFNQGVVTSPEQMMQGRAAGVQITTGSGEPGAGVNIRIRGTSSVRGGNNPLFVIDGVPMSGSDITNSGANAGFGASSARNPLNFLNAFDIETIDVLKDASATAIYGARGANGVVLITTKKGKGDGQLDYNYSLGVSQITKKYDLLGASDFLSAYSAINGPDATAALDGKASTDWQDEVLQTALSHTHNVGYGTGDERGGYRLSLGIQDQDGIIKTTGLKRTTFGLNGNRKFMDNRFELGTQLAIADIKDRFAPIGNNAGAQGDLIGAMLKANPTQAVYDADGEFIQPGTDFLNPVAMLELSKDVANTLRGVGSFYGQVNLMDNLSFRTVFGFDRSMSSRTSAYSRDLAGIGIQDNGRMILGNLQQNNSLWENYFNYNTAINDNVDLSGLLGYSYQQFNTSSNIFEMYGFRTGDVDQMINNLASVDASTGSGVAPVNSTRTKDEIQSYFTRWNVGISDKYLLTATLRVDGSTKFAGDNKYGIFPSFAARWRMSEESFVPDIFSDLSLRAGWGRTGNQELGHNLYLSRSRYSDWDINDGGGLTGGGANSVAFENPNLKWESTDMVNIGVDFEINKGRLYGAIDAYQKVTKDLLFLTTAAQPATQPFQWENLPAEVLNTGIEFLVGGYPVNKTDFSWNIASNIAFNKNTVKNYTSFVNTGEINGQGLTGAFAQRIGNDQPLFAYFLRDFQGYDADGISVYGKGDDDFQQFLGKSPLPKVIAGLTNAFTYQDFDFSFFFLGNFGHYLYNNTANAYFTKGALAGGKNVTTDVVGSAESLLNAPDVSTRFLEKGDFVRLQNITLGYNLRPGGKSVLSNVRLFVVAQNLATFTNYSGQDPEVNIDKSINGIPSAGIDYTAYPRAKIFTFGVNATFK